MVTATIAEIGPTRIDIRDNNGLVKQLRGDFTGDQHGISIDSADYALEQDGWVMGTPRWTGTYYKAVVHSEERFHAVRPAGQAKQMTDNDYEKVFGSPEGYVRIYPGRPDKLPDESAAFFRYQVERLRAQGK